MCTSRKTQGGGVNTYTYDGTQLSAMSTFMYDLYFTYDGTGTPVTVSQNGTTYYYVTNLQGDVIAILDGTGTKVVEYAYDAWGNTILTVDNSRTNLAAVNPLRYRGYIYDGPTGCYYLQSRYYNPKIGRFISADNYPSTGQGLTGNNMFAYCGNNPVDRKDSTGKFWTLVAKAAIGIACQYAADVIGNIISGEENIFKPTSSVGEYIAAGVTAMIPGSGFGVALIKNVVSESIVNIERAVLDEEINVYKSIGNIFLGSAFDCGTDKISGIIDTQMEKLVPKTYSEFAGNYRKLFPNATKEEIVNRQSLETMAMRRTKKFALLLVDTGNAFFKPNLYDFAW